MDAKLNAILGRKLGKTRCIIGHIILCKTWCKIGCKTRWKTRIKIRCNVGCKTECEIGCKQECNKGWKKDAIEVVKLGGNKGVTKDAKNWAQKWMLKRTKKKMQ